MAIIFDGTKYLWFTVFALVITIVLNLYNFWFIKNNVMSAVAKKKVKLSQKRVKEIYADEMNRKKRREAYERAMLKSEAKKSGKKYVDPKPKETLTDAEKKKNKNLLSDETLLQFDILKEKDGYYQYKIIEDKGFNKWYEAYTDVAKIIQKVGLFVNFKFYRMTYSYFLGRKCFLVLYQKKKFKKHVVTTTIMAMFFVELPLLICDIVAITSLPANQ